MASIYKRKGRGPWVIAWFDHTGRRREKSSRTTDYRTAERIAAKLEADKMLRVEGVVDARKDRFSIENRKPLADHAADYLAHCQRVGQAENNIVEKRRHLKRLLAETGLTRLADLTADALEHNLAGMAERYSARSINFRRQVAVAFLNWCQKHGRVESNPLSVVPKLDERKDRRRVRRPLTDDEVSRLLAVAEARGRKAWYLCAALAGLRRGDLQRLRWSDIDFDEGTITISQGKAKRVDVLPLHPQLVGELKRIRPMQLNSTSKVFTTAVTSLTQLKDFERANLKPDEQGRVVDLHALRATLGTQLARQGVAPQVAQQILRHSDYKTTLKHYTVLGLSDTAKAINQLPAIGDPQRDAATGTCDAKPQHTHQQYSQQSERQTVQSDASRCDHATSADDPTDDDKLLASARDSDGLRANATMCDNAAGVAQLVERQPSKLNVEGSSPFARFDESSCFAVQYCALSTGCASTVASAASPPAVHPQPRRRCEAGATAIPCSLTTGNSKRDRRPEAFPVSRCAFASRCVHFYRGSRPFDGVDCVCTHKPQARPAQPDPRDTIVVGNHVLNICLWSQSLVPARDTKVCSWLPISQYAHEDLVTDVPAARV